jgi:hypothetical protein
MNILEMIGNQKNLRQLKTMNKCKFCGSTELVYHQYIICDSKCQECGEWQNGDYLEDQDLSSTGSPYFHHKNKKDE